MTWVGGRRLKNRVPRDSKNKDHFSFFCLVNPDCPKIGWYESVWRSVVEIIAIARRITWVSHNLLSTQRGRRSTQPLFVFAWEYWEHLVLQRCARRHGNEVGIFMANPKNWELWKWWIFRFHDVCASWGGNSYCCIDLGAIVEIAVPKQFKIT